MENAKKTSIAISTIRAYDISKPAQISRMANVIKSYVVKNKLFVPIAGKNYVMVEGWQFAGGLMGLFPKVVKVENLGDNKWLAQVDIIARKDGSVAGSGFALCSKSENKKASFDEYAILSMAQTRAIGKAYRNLIGWVMKLAGYEGTPAEEIKVKPSVSSTTETQEPSLQKISELRDMLKGNTDKEKLTDLNKRAGIKLADFKISPKHAGLIVATLLNLETK